MQKYNIAALMQRQGRRHAHVILPPISERLSMQRTYLAIMRRLLKGIAHEVMGDVLTVYRVELMRDADAQSFDRLRRIAEYLVGVASQSVNRVLNLESQQHTEKFMKVAQSALGIDISSVVSQGDLQQLIEMAARRNAGLIKSQTETMIQRIEAATLQNKLAGNSVATLRKKLIEEFGIGERKAKLLARDQSSKLTSDLNQFRQRQAGITEYDWSTANDERVRPLHRSLNGNRYQWGKPTGAEEGLPPGQPIQCRCVARGVVEF